MAVLEYDIRAECGQHWRRNFNWITNGEDAPIAECSARLIVRSDFDSEAIVMLTDGSGITLTDGNVYIEFTPVQIGMVRDDLTVVQGPFLAGVFDLQLTYLDGTQQIFLAGKFVVRRSVTAQ